MPSNAERYEGLEPTADNLARILGPDGARSLSDALGGRRLYVPRHPGPHHVITVALGPDGAARLAAAFGSEEIDIPMMPQRASEIVRLAAAGLTRRQIAVQLRCTARWVYKVLEEHQDLPAQQPSFFD